jgi:hypothetical protein
MTAAAADRRSSMRSREMTLSFLFWLLMILWLIFGFWQWRPTAPANYAPFGGHLLLWVLLFLIGWRVFGFVIQG